MKKNRIILVLIILIANIIFININAQEHNDYLPHGGSPENTIVIINPLLNHSKYIGNYYKNIRNIPDKNILYMDPYASNYDNFNSTNLDALLGTMENLGIEDHIDYIIVSTVPYQSTQYRISSQSYVSSTCAQMYHMSISSVYTTPFIKSRIFANTTIYEMNHYSQFSFSASPYAFDNSFNWSWGTNSSEGDRYFIGALLGYTGSSGNTVNEIISMINRSASVDGTRPSGTFYFVRTSDVARSGPRDWLFSGVSEYINNISGNSLYLNSNATPGITLPIGKHDILGIMTGAANPGIVAANMTMLPGSYGDHLTSFAGVLSGTGQEELTEYIKKGASGSSGTVEEPCNFDGKFSRSDFHIYYYKGLSLGEAYLRSIEFVPFQNLLVGDPLTRPFGYLPIVNVSMDNGVISGITSINVNSITNNPNATISHHDLYIDGIFIGFAKPGEGFNIDTSEYADGYHDIRVVSYDTSSVSTPGRWIGISNFNNYGNEINISSDKSTGDLSTLFNISVFSNNINVREIRILMNNRVIASTSLYQDSLLIHSNTLGAGRVKIIAEAEYNDGRMAISSPIYLEISYSNQSNISSRYLPIAYNYSKAIYNYQPVLFELPGMDLDGASLTYSIINLPNQSGIAMNTNTLSQRLLRPLRNATNSDIIRYSVTNSNGTANGFITLNYEFLPYNPPISTLDSPINSYNINLSSVIFRCNSSDNSNLNNITFFIWNSTNSIIYSNTTTISGTFNSSLFRFNFTYFNNYKWNCLVTNNNSYFDWDNNRTLIISDTIYPKFSNYTDNNGTLTDSGTALFNVSVIESNGSVYLNINNLNYSSLNSNLTYYNLINLTTGVYNYRWCSYGIGASRNLNCSLIKSYTVLSTPAPAPSSGGGGGSSGSGGGGTRIVLIKNNTIDTTTNNSIDLKNGLTISLVNNNTLKFKNENKIDYIDILEINNSEKNIELKIKSINQIVLMNSGEERKFDTNNDQVYDLYIKINNIENNSFSIFIKTINETKQELEKEEIIITNNSQNDIIPSQNQNNEGFLILMFKIVIIILVILIFSVIGLIVYYFLVSRKSIVNRIGPMTINDHSIKDIKVVNLKEKKNNYI